MNIRRYFSAVLICAAALLLVSCGGLTSAKGETETFSFSLGTVISEASARNSGLTGTATYTITLKSTQGNAYFSQISNTAAVSALNTMTLDFEDVPVGVELAIHIFIETDQELYFEGESEPFTMQTGKDAELSIALEKLFSTPYLLWSYSGQNYTYSQAARLSATATTLPNGPSSRIDNFCWDEDDTLWYVYSNKLFNSESASPFFPSINFVDIDYDYQTKKIFALTKSNNTYHLLVVDSNILKTATQLDSTNTDDVELMLVVGDQRSDKSDISGAVENGIYYSVYSCGDLWGLQCNTYIPGGVTAYPKVTYNLSSQSLLTMWGGKITPLSNDSIIQSDFIVYKDI